MNYQLWTDNIKDILVPHIYKGLTEMYNGVRKITKDFKPLLAFQVALEGLPEISQSKIVADYDVLSNTLHKNNYSTEWFDSIVKNAVVNYTKMALTSHGLNCENMNEALIEAPTGPEFVHKVYISAAREIWSRPELFWHNYSNTEKQHNVREVLSIIKNAVDNAVRNSVNLKQITTAFQTGQLPPTQQKHRLPTLKEKFNQINRGRTILDSDEEEEDDFVTQAAHSIGERRPMPLSREQLLRPPPTPSSIGTIDDDDRAPDTETIQSDDNDINDNGEMRISLGGKSKDVEHVEPEHKPTPKPEPESVEPEPKLQLKLADKESDSDTTPVPSPSLLPKEHVSKKGGAPSQQAGEELMSITLDPGTKYVPPTDDANVVFVKKIRNDDEVSTYTVDSDSSDSVKPVIKEISQKSGSPTEYSVRTTHSPLVTELDFDDLPECIRDAPDIISETDGDTCSEADKILFKHAVPRKEKQQIINMSGSEEMTIPLDNAEKAVPSNVSIKLQSREEALSHRLQKLKSTGSSNLSRNSRPHHAPNKRADAASQK